MKKSSKGYVAIIAAMFIPLIFSFFYLNMYMSEIKHDQSIFDNAVKQTALRVARQRLHHLDGNQEQTNHLNRIAAITFNDWMKVKSSIDKNIFSIKVNDVTYGARQRSEFRHYSSKNGGSYGWCSQRHWLWSNYVEDFYDNYDPDGERVVDYVSVNDSSSDFNAEGYALSNLMTGAPSITKTICQSTTSNIKITNDDDENIQVEATAKFGKYNKTYKATYKASPPKLNADIVLCIPVNSAACNTCNDPYATEDQIDNLYSNSTDYYHNAARDTPIWQIKTAFRQFMRQIIGYTECGVGIIPYSGNVAIHGWHYFDEKTIPFDGFHYANYDAVNPQVPVAESFKFATHEDYHLSINKDKEHANWGPSQRSFTPLIYRSDINGMLESYMNGNSDGSDVSKSLYSLVDQNTKFMRRAVDINPCGNINVLAGYSIRKENSYPHPYPMLGIINKTSEPYRYLTTFMPFADHSNKSNFLYLPLMFGASMLLNGFGELNYYNVENAKNRKKCLILVDNMGDLFAPHELTYFGMSNDASYLTLVNGERLDYESGDLELVDGYYQNKIHDYCNKTHSERVAIKCNYTKDSTNGTYELKTPQPGNIKMVVHTEADWCVHAKIYQNNIHSSGVEVSNVSASEDGVESYLDTSDSSYYCGVKNIKDAETEYKIEFTGIYDMSNPVIAQIELFGCEVSSLESLDGKFVLRQDENYVYICYDDTFSGTYWDSSVLDSSESDSSIITLSDNEAILKLKIANEATQHDTLSYIGKTLSENFIGESSLSASEYNFGDIYNVKLNGDFYSKCDYTKNYKFSEPGTSEKTFFAGHYDLHNTEYYAQGYYGVRALVRMFFSDSGIFYPSNWTNLPGDWIYGNTWGGFSGTNNLSTNNCLSSITATFCDRETLALNHTPPKEYLPHVKIYKNNGHNDVKVTNIEYKYGDNYFSNRHIIDMGDYFVAYFWFNESTFRININNKSNCKTVYVKMELFGSDISTTLHDQCIYRHDEDFLYMCYNGTELGETASLDVVFDTSDSSVKDTEPLSYFSGHLLPAKYDSTYDSGISKTKEEISKLESAIENLYSQITETEADIYTLDSTISGLESELYELDSSKTELEQLYIDWKNAYDSASELAMSDSTVSSLVTEFNNKHKEIKVGTECNWYTVPLSYCVEVSDPLNATNEVVNKYEQNINSAIIACKNLHQWGVDNSKWGSFDTFDDFDTLEFSEFKAAVEKINMYEGSPFWGYNPYTIVLSNGTVEQDASTPLYIFYTDIARNIDFNYYYFELYLLYAIKFFEDKREEIIADIVSAVQEIQYTAHGVVDLSSYQSYVNQFNEIIHDSNYIANDISEYEKVNSYITYITSKNTELNALKAQRSALQNKIDSLNEEISQEETALEEAKSTLNGLQDRWDSSNMLENTFTDESSPGYQLYVTDKGNLIHHIYSGYISSNYSVDSTIEFPINYYNVYTQEGRWHIRYWDLEEEKHADYLNDPYLDPDIYPAYNYDYNKGTGKYGIRVEGIRNYTHGLKLLANDSSCTIQYEPFPEIFNLYDRYAFSKDFSKIKFEHRIEAAAYNVAKREFKSKENDISFQIPHVIIYKKPGYYVPFIEGDSSVEEYYTVEKVEKDGAGVLLPFYDKNNEIEGWKCYSTDGITYNSTTKTWGFDENKIEDFGIKITLKADLPAYPVLVKMKCFNMSMPQLLNNGNRTDPDGTHYVRQDDECYYICTISSKNKSDVQHEKAIEIPMLYSIPSNTNPAKWPLSFANMRLLGASSNDDSMSSFKFEPGSKNPYTVYGHNCSVNVKVSRDYTYNPSWYYVDDQAKNLSTYASYISEQYDSTYNCYYTDYFCSYNGYPQVANFNSSFANIGSIQGFRLSVKTRSFKSISSGEHAHTVTLNSSKPSYSTSYALTSGYNVIYIPRQGDKDTTWDSTDTFDLNIGLNNAKICSIEWSNHLNGIEGCYPCANQDGHLSTDDSGNLAVYYEPIKKGKNCRWVDCTLNEQEKKEDSSDFKLTDGNIVVGSFDYGISETPFLWKSINNESDVFDSGIYKDLTGIWHLKGFNRDDKRVAIFAEINESAVSHGDFNFILNNAYGVSNVDVWFAHHYKSYENKDDEGNKDGSHIYHYNYMNGVGRYFQPTHTNAYNMLNGFDSITLCARIATPADQLILGSIECTNEVNRILMAIGAQTLDMSDSSATNDLPNISPTQALKKDVTPNMIKTVKSELGANGRIYVIHYRKEGQDEDPNTLHLDNYDSSNDSSAVDSDSECQIIDYGARNLDELNKVMSDILTDIKKFAGSTDAQIIE